MLSAHLPFKQAIHRRENLKRFSTTGNSISHSPLKQKFESLTISPEQLYIAGWSIT